MKRFSEEVRTAWKRSGYSTVKITGSEHMEDNMIPDLLYVLVEPFGPADSSLEGCDMIAPISCGVVTSIIERNAGLHRPSDN